LTDWDYCEEILPKVSRTFALNIGRLKGETYRATLLGYLLFRIADTFEDSRVPCPKKIEALHGFAQTFEGNKPLEERLGLYESLVGRLLEDEGSPEAHLVKNGGRVLRCYFDLPAAYREIMDPRIVETAFGMAKFQMRKEESKQDIFQLRDLNELREYCYYVAGNVGVMLTQLFCLRDGLLATKPRLLERQVDFGLALQLTNIVKDHLKDLERGWCYIPASVIKIEEIHQPEAKGKILKEMLPHLVEHLDATLGYIETIPKKEKDIRLFCLIPFVLAYNTLIEVGNGKEKLSRPQVAAILGQCEIFARSNDLLRRDYLGARRKLLGDE
jgi:farnesyl-diphosphate farnesyltransferase